MGKSLKSQYQWRLAIVFAVNLIAIQATFQSGSFDVGQIVSSFGNLKEQWAEIGSTALALAVLTIINGLLPSDIKARIAFWRWRDPLPGSRAFSKYLRQDPRIDVRDLEARLGIFPTSPKEQNALWYKLYRSVQSEIIVNNVHRDFLFARDYAALSFSLLLLGGGLSIQSTPWFCLVLLGQYVLTSLAAQHYGTRLVTTSVAAWLTSESSNVPSSSTPTLQVPVTP